MSPARGLVRRTGARFVLRWEVLYDDGDGMATHTLHFTRVGARVSRFMWQ